LAFAASPELELKKWIRLEQENVLVRAKVTKVHKQNDASRATREPAATGESARAVIL